MGVLMTLFFIYSNFTGSIDLEVLGFELGRQRFFLVFFALFLTINLLILLAIKAAHAAKKVSNKLHSEQVLRITVASKLMVCGANIFLIILMSFLRPTADTHIDPGSWDWLLLLVGPVVIVFGLLFLLFVLV